MSFFVQKNTGTPATTVRVLLYLVSPADGKTPVTGLTFTTGDIVLSKNGAAEANATAANVVEIGNGLYYYKFGSAEVDTLGFLYLRVTKTSVLPFVREVQVVDFDPTAMRQDFAEYLLETDISINDLSGGNRQTNANKFSLLTALLKSVSKVANVAGVMTTYKVDGTTVKLSQTISTNPADLPIDSIGVGS
jgi:hypothetical protein